MGHINIGFFNSIENILHLSSDVTDVVHAVVVFSFHFSNPLFKFRGMIVGITGVLGIIKANLVQDFSVFGFGVLFYDRFQVFLQCYRC